MIKKLVWLSLLSAFAIMLFSPRAVEAAIPIPYSPQTFTVKSTIFIPANWKDRITQEQIEKRFKPDIVKGVNEVRSFYAQQLNGKTFNFDESIDVIYSNKGAEGAGAEVASDVFGEAGGWDLVPQHDRTINLIWVIGSSNLVCGAWSATPKAGYQNTAAMNHEYLLALNSSAPEEERSVALGVISHELGHTFGAVDSGYARAHPCSEESPQECVTYTPRPLPQHEYDNSIMGTGAYIYPRSIFNNTIYNPEVWKFYQSPWLNPQKDPAPKPRDSKKYKSIGEISVSPNPASVNETIEINGRNLGTGGRVELSEFGDIYQAEIVSWNDDRIVAKIRPETAPPGKRVRRYVKVIKSGEETPRCRRFDNDAKNCDLADCHYFACTDQCWPFQTWEQDACRGFETNTEVTSTSITVKGIDTPPQLLVEMNFTATCVNPDTNQEQPLAGAQVFGGTQIMNLVRTNSQGNATITTFAAPGEKLGAGALAVDTLGNQIFPQEEFKTITIPEGAALLSFDPQLSFEFHYPACPITQTRGHTGMGEPGKPSPTPTEVAACENRHYWDPNAEEQKGACIHKFSEGKYPDCEPYVFDKEENSDLCHDKPSFEVTPPSTQTSPAEGQSEITPAVSEPVSESTNNTSTPPEQPIKHIDSITLSSYEDFRDTNVPGDEGSQTASYTPTDQPQNVDWTLSTLDQHPPIYIRKIFSDNTFEDSQITLSRNNSTTIEFLEIHAKQERKATEILVNGQSVDINNPELSLHLEGTEGQDQDFVVPVLVKYSNGDEESADLHINYRPDHAPVSTPAVTVPAEQNTPAPGQPETTTPPPGQESTPAPESGGSQPPQSPQSPPPSQPTCDNIYYWDGNANDGSGACIHKHTDGTYPDCEPYNFTKTSDNNCPDKP